MQPRQEPANPFRPARPFTAFRRLFCEGFGTFLLVSVDCGAAMTAQLSHGDVTPVARSVATGLLVMAMSSAMADVSGAHFNPAITLAFTMRRAASRNDQRFVSTSSGSSWWPSTPARMARSVAAFTGISASFITSFAASITALTAARYSASTSRSSSPVALN